MKGQSNKKRRGFTLAELTVVLAVMTVVATLAVTFSSLLSDRRAQSQAGLDAMTDISVAESTIGEWIQSNAVAMNADGEAVLTAEGEKNIRAENGRLYIDGMVVYTFKRVSSITFARQEKDGHTIYFCSAAYTLPKRAETKYYTFCVYKPALADIEGGKL